MSSTTISLVIFIIDSAGIPLSEIPKLVSFSSVEHEIFVTSIDAESLAVSASPGRSVVEVNA